MQIRLTNSKTRRKEDFVPLDPANVRMYVCGPTVYDRAHLGNARPVVVFDVLFRLLRHVYGPDHVRYVRNFTDVDDKINARAAESGREISEITEETARWYLEDMAAIGALEPTDMPRATGYIDKMVAMIADLIDRGHAYEAEGHVLFSVSSYPEYGRLSGRSLDDMIAGARVEVAPYKRDPMDFVLWKPSAPDLPGWDSPWGRGRPGWHIECSAMSHALLGESFDIHGGGNDLLFPHHENEVAQSACAHPEGDFAKVWLHNEMLQVEGKKMSKSLGNFFTVRELLDGTVKGQPNNLHGAVVRLVFLNTHYRKPMDWRSTKAHEAIMRLDAWARELSGSHADDLRKEFVGQEYEFTKRYAPVAVVEALRDDLNTSKAISELVAIGKTIESSRRADFTDYELDEKHGALLAGLYLLGIDILSYAEHMHSIEPDLVEWETRLAEARAAAMDSKDFAEVDRLKAALTGAGVEVRMSKAGVELLPGPGFDPGKLAGVK